MFNALTGSNQYVGNWPGVTVEKKEGKLKKHDDVMIEDLPGIYSLSPYTMEEVISRNFLMDEEPDAILNIVDGTNLERNLYLTTQLAELGIPVVVAVNMMDLVEKNGDTVDTDKLSKTFGVPFYKISALKSDGILEAAEAAIKAAKSHTLPNVVKFGADVEKTLTAIEENCLGEVPAHLKRWFAIKVFERDDKALAKLNLAADKLAAAENYTAELETKLEDDSESIITNERYEYITGSLHNVYRKKAAGELSISDKIDRIVTNRWAALPIFAAVMFLVYFLSIQTVGGWATDWVNDVLFGEIVPNAVGGWLENLNVAPWLSGLILDGIIAGVGAVLGFVPQMLVLFFCLALLEGCGYMARIAFIMDRIFRKFGLSGKSFIPMMIGTGCGVPGVMASRTIENERDRRMTVMTTTFIPCSAKLPIIAMIAGALFNDSALVGWSAYFLGIFAIVVSGIILKKTKRFAGEPAPFVMELPAYHMPTLGSVLRSMWERGYSFIKKAGSVILLATILIWFLSYFGVVDGTFRMLEEEEMDFSLLAAIGNAFAWLFAPLGWGTWKPAVATVTGLIAKENVVGTFGILYHTPVETEAGEEIWSLLAQDYTALQAYSFLAFNLLCAPCFAAIGAIKREMNNAKWTWFAIGWECGFAYVMSLIIYRIGAIFTGEASFGVWTVLAIACIALMVWALFCPYKEADKLTVK